MPFQPKSRSVVRQSTKKGHTDTIRILAFDPSLAGSGATLPTVTRKVSNIFSLKKKIDNE